MNFTGQAVKGTLHHYSPRLVAFEHARSGAVEQQSPNVLLWVGGLSDGLMTTAYPTILAQKLPPGYTLVQPLLSSSYLGWGTSSIQTDAKELGQCVAYLQRIKFGGKIVLMGLSTGCQDIIQYLITPGSPRVDGAIIQAGISDREGLGMMLDAHELKSDVVTAKAMVARGRGDEVMPANGISSILSAAITANRFLSLISPDHNGDEDIFSSDLSDEQLRATFGSLPAASPLCILSSGADGWVPGSVDKEALLRRWITAVKQGTGKVDEEFSAVIKGASHTYQGVAEEVLSDMFRRVTGFLGKIA